MAYICSIGLGIPNYSVFQHEVKDLVQEIFPLSNRRINKYMSVFDHAKIVERQLVVDKDWFRISHSFEEKNNTFKELAVKYTLEAVDNCLHNEDFLKESFPYEAIDMIIFVTSTGISTPSLDAYIMNHRPFREDVVRIPIWGLGCAGGAAGLSRAFDWISAHKDKTALLICCELCSLTFQENDASISNLVGTALFGDGVSATLLIGKESPYLPNKRKNVPEIVKTSSVTKKATLTIMGWEVTNNGLQVIFSKRIPKYVKSFWNKHLDKFLKEVNLEKEEIHSFIAHPGGIKVLQAIEDILDHANKKLFYSYETLYNHGNMSSATVIYVLEKWMHENINKNEKSILTALGPGFSSEILLLEWK